MRIALRFAARELRSGVAGFRIFLACLALGVAAIAAAGSTAEAFRQGLSSQAREILGGDVIFTVEQRRFTADERDVFSAFGPTAYSVRANAMAETSAGLRRLVDVRGVGDEYPLVGDVVVAGAPSLALALMPQAGVPGAAVEQALLDRLGLRLGDQFVINRMPVVARAVLVSEPDRLGRGFALGPRVLLRASTVERASLLGEGGLFGESVRLVLPLDSEPKAVIAAVRQRFPDASFEARDRSEAAAGAGRLIDQLEYFLGFIGLASLVAGGLGVAGAVSAYLDERKRSIATLKALGAEGAFVRDVYLIQIGALAALGILIGIIVGAATPLVIGRLAADSLPVPALFAIYPQPLARAAIFGVLAAAAFSLWPLAKARTTPPSAMFRQELATRPRIGIEAIGAIVAGIGLATLAVLSAPSRLAALAMIGGTIVAFFALWGLGLASAALAGRLRGLTRGAVRLGLANLSGPRSAARTASPAIGLGVALLTTIILIQSSLLAQIGEVAPRTAPSMVFTEIPGDRVAEFDAVIARSMNEPAADRYTRLPLITGRITRIHGRPVDIETIDRDERWAFDQDLILSALDGEPVPSGTTAGRWWTADYAGPPLIAFEQDAARAAGLGVGDTVTLQVLGREIDARIAVLREIDWGGFGANFAVILNSAAVEGANPRHVAIARASPAQEETVTRALARDFGAVNVISVREQLEQAATLFDRLALAIRGAAAVASGSGVLVLVGAIAAGARLRAREAATLKVLGGTRRQILTAYLVEYGLVGAIAGTAGVALGTAAAWPVVTLVFDAAWRVDWISLFTLIGGTTALAAVGGGVAGLVALSRRPASILRRSLS
ncbi:ABC transporter permease [Brevundimonas variabilis]|uniref:Putative ABC transport system permease protein n=1 Tax=Brevundimonas variabilis TaxID=74312 RepID=A0A7W9CKY9_9CAUL|nr:FtsX-like permease family protein [Brevundimonas variabilis]MBB5747630.1 putative ABC transport system permease protein [Brevundimonas variabilis]